MEEVNVNRMPEVFPGPFPDTKVAVYGSDPYLIYKGHTIRMADVSLLKIVDGDLMYAWFSENAPKWVSISNMPVNEEPVKTPNPEKLYACEDIPELGEGAKIIRIGNQDFIKKGNIMMTVFLSGSFVLDDKNIRYARESDLK